MDKKDKRKGDFQHKIFKFIILVIVFVFILLIIGFIYIQIFPGTKEENLIKKYEYLKKQDYIFYGTSSFGFRLDVQECNLDKFLVKHISENVPCVIRYDKERNNQYGEFINKILSLKTYTTQEIGLLYFAEPYMNFLEMKNQTSIADYSHPSADNIARFFISVNPEKHFYISPITEFKSMKAFKNETYKEFNTLYSKIDLSTIKQSILHFVAKLNKGDLIYIPSFFFTQIIEGNEGLISYEYSDTTKVHQTMLKALFDDDKTKIFDYPN